MATLNFIKGSFHGKVGQFVGSSWKGKDYIKLYTPPGNPKTAGQTAVRTIFQHVVHIAHALYEPVLKPYTFPKPRGMTAFNRMVHINKELFDDKQWDISKVQVFAGSLFNPGITGAAVDAQSGTAVVITFNGGEGEATDIPVGVVHDEVSNQTFCAVGEKRESGSVKVPPFHTPPLCYNYRAFSLESKPNVT
jgi:hypothetical protein